MSAQHLWGMHHSHILTHSFISHLRLSWDDAENMDRTVKRGVYVCPYVHPEPLAINAHSHQPLVFSPVPDKQLNFIPAKAARITSQDRKKWSNLHEKGCRTKEARGKRARQELCSRLVWTAAVWCVMISPQNNFFTEREDLMDKSAIVANMPWRHFCTPQKARQPVPSYFSVRLLWLMSSEQWFIFCRLHITLLAFPL